MSEKKELIQFLSQFVQPERLALLKSVLDQRTQYATVVLEDIFQAQNASAVIRTCDCFGIQDAHIIENEHEYTLNPDVVRGAGNWVTINKYKKKGNNTAACLTKLKEQGYRIVATSPHANGIELPDFDVTKGKFAFVFGSEKPGVSSIVKEMADEFVKIPMYGFTESFNISVSAALCLQSVSNQLRKLPKEVIQLEESIYDDILIHWMKKSMKHGPKVEKEFYNRRG